MEALLGREGQESLYKILEKLYRESYSPADNVRKRFDYYYGNFKDSSRYSNISSYSNVIKQIVDTKTTFILDSQITTQVVPSLASFRSVGQTKGVEDVADLLDNCLNHVRNINKFPALQEQIVRNGLIAGFQPLENIWDGEKDDVGKGLIDPALIRWEKDSRPGNSNYYIIDSKETVMSLKKRYATDENGVINEEMLGKINALAKIATDSSAQQNRQKQPRGVSTLSTTARTEQAFTYGRSTNLENINNTIMVHKLYTIDDTVFLPDDTDGSGEAEAKQELRFKYPYGRVVIWAGENNNYCIFEDKPLDYQFGFPITFYYPQKTDSTEGYSEVDALMLVQDRINNTYERLRMLVAKYVSILCIDANMVDIAEESFINDFVVKLENLKAYGAPQVITNNTLSEIRNVIDLIAHYKNDAKEIARINDLMISGTVPGIESRSGEQLKELKQSPMATIRGLQVQWIEFLKEDARKDIKLIQQFYKTPRVIRIGKGGNFAEIPNQEYDLKGNPIPRSVNIYDAALGKAIKSIGDFTIGDYEIEIVAGSEVPRSRTENAAIVTELYNTGKLGDPNDPDVMEIYLKAIDYPMWRNLVDLKKSKLQNSPPPLTPPTDKIIVNLKDLPLPWLNAWGQANGFPSLSPEDISTVVSPAGNLPETNQQGVNQ